MIRQKDGFEGERAIVIPMYSVQEMEVHPLASVLHITDIGYYPRALHHYRERNEPISQYVFIYCVSGAGWYRVGNVTYEVHEHQYFILPPNLPHAYGADEQNPWTIYWVHFKGKMASCFMDTSMTPRDVKPTTHSRIHDRIQLFEEIFHVLEMGYSRENLLYACTAFYHFLGTLAVLQSYRAAAYQLEPGEEADDIIAAAIHFMKENIEKRIPLEEIARKLGYSVSYFSMRFKHDTGYSPITYFNQLKIQRACELLDFTPMRINQICYKIGIDDPYYFTRLFKQVMGLSPMQYKRQKKG